MISRVSVMDSYRSHDMTASTGLPRRVTFTAPISGCFASSSGSEASRLRTSTIARRRRIPDFRRFLASVGGILLLILWLGRIQADLLQDFSLGREVGFASGKFVDAQHKRGDVGVDFAVQFSGLV